MKKLLALCLTVVLVLAMMPIIGASAAESATFSVDSVTGAPGEEVTVAVSIDTNPGLTYAQVLVGYDADVLEPVKIETLTFAGTPTSCGPTTLNPLRVTWANGLADTTATGDIANITFKIKDDAAEGTYALEVSANQADVYDTAFNDVPFTCESGAITVSSGVVEPPVIEPPVINGLTFLAGNVAGNAGDEVSVPVSIAGNTGTGLTYAQVLIGYDANVLEPVKIETLTFAGTPTSCGPTTLNPLRVTWANGLVNTTDNGDIAKVIFKIKDGVANGTYEITVSANQADVYDTAFNDVPYTCINGKVTVGSGAVVPPVGCDHGWISFVDDKYIATEATCTAKATYYKSCAVCGEKNTEATFEAGEFADHAWAEVVDEKYFVTAATCTDKAVYNKSCSVCGEASDETFKTGELAAHTWAEVVDDKYLATEATCIAKATYNKSCSVCEKAGTETFEAGEFGGHTAAQVVDDKYLATEATCENQATYYNSCSVCGEKLDATFPSGELAEHKYGDWVTTKEPTETEAGSKEKVCSVCGDKVTEEIPVVVPGECTHANTTKHEAVESTCTVAGNAEYVTCDDCGVVVEGSDAKLPLADHNYGEWVTTKEPTFTEVGTKEKECSVCGDKVTEEIPVLTPPEENKVSFVIGEVTGAPGEEVTVSVSIADNIGITNTQILVNYNAEALEVVSITPVKFAGIEATYGPTENNPISISWTNGLENTTENGVIANITFKIKDTAAAGDYALAVSIDPENVFDVEFNNVPFTTVDGVISVCVHEWANVVADKYLATEATCTAKATYYKTCALCGAVSDETFENGEMLDHTAVQVADEKYLATAATCIDVATYYSSCEVCGAKLDATFPSGEVNADNHAGEKTTHAAVESTCTVAGNAEYVTCDDCGVVVEGSDAKLPLAEHTYAEVVDEKYLATEATCTAKATYYKSCSVCGVASDETFEAGELLAHTWAEVVDEKYLVTAATCEAKAVYNKSCEVCGEATDETFEGGEFAAHELTHNEAVDAKCDATGSIENWSCSVCEKIFSDAEAKTEITAEETVVEKVEHKYGDWVTTKEPTSNEAGSKEKVCADCGDKVVEVLPVVDKGTESPATSDVNIFVVASMIMALAAAAVVVLKKKA